MQLQPHQQGTRINATRGGVGDDESLRLGPRWQAIEQAKFEGRDRRLVRLEMVRKTVARQIEAQPHVREDGADFGVWTTRDDPLTSGGRRIKTELSEARTHDEMEPPRVFICPQNTSAVKVLCVQPGKSTERASNLHVQAPRQVHKIGP